MARENDYSGAVRQAVREARQLNHWLRGRSVHLWMPDLCTPDYSCCEPELLAPLEERELYVQARNEEDVETLERLDVMFFGAADCPSGPPDWMTMRGPYERASCDYDRPTPP